ncbi:hybrid signal transduction histidine kinase M [Tanacetum coccineum]
MPKILALMAVQRQTAASRSARPPRRVQHGVFGGVPTTRWTRSLSKLAHTPNLRVSFGQVAFGGCEGVGGLGFGDGGGGQDFGGEGGGGQAFGGDGGGGQAFGGDGGGGQAFGVCLEVTNVKKRRLRVRAEIVGCRNVGIVVSYVLSSSKTSHTIIMTNGDTPPPQPPTLSHVDKLYAVHNITSLVPVKHDVDKSNYSSWCYFFKIHCANFGVLKHIEDDDTSSPTSPPPPTPEWLTADSIVKSWIFLTLAKTLQRRLIKVNPTTAKAAWKHVEKIFLDNKRTRTIALKGELRVIKMGDLSVDEYFHKIESIVTLLNDLGSPMSDDDVASYAMYGLSDKFAHVAGIIAHRDPFPDLDTMRSMVTTEEMRLNSMSHNPTSNTTSSAPTVLVAETHNNRSQESRSSRDTRFKSREYDPQICRNFSRGFCKWGNTCKFIHDAKTQVNNSHMATGTSHNARQQQVNGSVNPIMHNSSNNRPLNGLGTTS